MISKLLLIASSVLLPFLFVVVSSEGISETCRQETAPLLEDSSLAVAQSIVFEDYTASFNERCNFGLEDVGCSIKFEGDERTYNALCESQGGQVFQSPVVLSCLLGTVEYDLGSIPTCVGASCNVTNLNSGDVSTEQVEAFLDNLTIVGCNAESGATSIISNSFVWALSTALAFNFYSLL